ncbi:MAG: rod shape-determining protein MreC [Cyanobacteria bacterium P01_H01_bin.121]
MYSLRRWWDRYGTRLTIIVGALGIAWFVRQTNGLLINEIQYYLTAPFQATAPEEDWLLNAQVLQLQEQLLELESQNQTLRELVGDRTTAPSGELFAPVMMRGADHWWQQLVIGRGSQAGIQAGAVVTAPGGLVGRITQTTPNTSRILLLSDPTSSVGVMVSRSRSQGFMRGQNSNQVVMRFFDKEPDVQVGDVVVTSSMSTLFPQGLPVGIIQSVQFNATPAPQAVIQLTAPLSRLEWVQVIAYEPENILTPEPEPTTILSPNPATEN